MSRGRNVNSVLGTLVYMLTRTVIELGKRTHVPSIIG